MTLNELPTNHILRNTPLIEIGAEYRNVDSKVWNKAVPSMKIAIVTYNRLGEAWTKYDVWRSLTPIDQA